VRETDCVCACVRVREREQDSHGVSQNNSSILFADMLNNLPDTQRSSSLPICVSDRLSIPVRLALIQCSCCCTSICGCRWSVHVCVSFLSRALPRCEFRVEYSGGSCSCGCGSCCSSWLCCRRCRKKVSKVRPQSFCSVN